MRLVTTLPERYERIALVSADSRNDFASQQNLSDAAIRRLKEEAAKVGANGVLLNGIGNYQVGASGIVVPTAGGPILTGAMNSRTGKEATGVAIYIPEQ